MIKPRILVTGAAGRNASTAVLDLLGKGFPVRAFVRRHDARSEKLKQAGAEICFEGPVTTGAPQQCPPLDCLVDGPDCMDPYGYIRVDLPNQALHAFAQLVEGHVSDLEFDDQIRSMLAEGQITVDAKPAKTRYLPLISLTVGLFLGLVIVVLLGFAYRAGRSTPS